MGAKLEGEKTNPRGSDLIFQPNWLLDWFPVLLFLESPRGHFVPSPDSRITLEVYILFLKVTRTEEIAKWIQRLIWIARLKEAGWQKQDRPCVSSGSSDKRCTSLDSALLHHSHLVNWEHEPWDQRQGLTAGSMPCTRGGDERVQLLGEETQLLYNHDLEWVTYLLWTLNTLSENNVPKKGQYMINNK